MKNIFKLTAISAVLSLSLTSLGAEDFSKLDVKKECDVQSNGVEKVIQTAEKYNKIAKEHKVEFMRLGMKASQYIEAVQGAIKSGAKNIDIVDDKKVKTSEATVEFGAWRACSFAISALTQEEEAKKTWRESVPGDGYKY